MMMDELDILKKDWKKSESSFNQITEKEIYGMLHKKSSSIVKWILVISILEIAFWSVLGFFTADENYLKTLEQYHLREVMPIITTLNYGVILFFIYLFYKNYKTINTTDTVKQLMHTILKTRKTVQHYVWYNLIMTFLSMVLVVVFQLKYDPNIEKVFKNVSSSMDSNLFYLMVTFFYIIVIVAVIGFIWLFYKLIYGILMKRLNNNYKELKKIDL
jgi:ABC-type multidrug transport system fused ATPase/permease subunit